MLIFFVIFFHKKFGGFKNCCTFAPLLFLIHHTKISKSQGGNKT
nr:MAG TPA: hypothetical protein [Caudoviricetes sp.]